MLNRIVDKTKLKGLVDEDISNGMEAKKIAMYNQVDDQKPPPLAYHTEVGTKKKPELETIIFD